MEYLTHIREIPALRESFFRLARATFSIDFSRWYARGHWTDDYLPHVLAEDGRVLACVAVNRMHFLRNGKERNYLQLGTVMTDPAFRGRGLGRQLLERVLADWRDKADGIYLFANDSVLDYYPQFGFERGTECCFSATCTDAAAYAAEKVNLSDPAAAARLEEKLLAAAERGSPNDGLLMDRNLGLYRFWLAEAYGDCLYYLPEPDAYAAAVPSGDRLEVAQVLGNTPVDLSRLAAAFPGVKRVCLGYTPGSSDGFDREILREPDHTLFFMGERLKDDLAAGLRFPVFSIA